MTEPHRLERPTQAFYLLDDGTVVFEFIGEDGTEHEHLYDDPDYITGIGLNYQRAAILLKQVQNGRDFDEVAQECGGIKLTTDIESPDDIDWGGNQGEQQ